MIGTIHSNPGHSRQVFRGSNNELIFYAPLFLASQLATIASGRADELRLASSSHLSLFAVF
jgi:hypothetical protein